MRNKIECTVRTGPAHIHNHARHVRSHSGDNLGIIISHCDRPPRSTTVMSLATTRANISSMSRRVTSLASGSRDQQCGTSKLRPKARSLPALACNRFCVCDAVSRSYFKTRRRPLSNERSAPVRLRPTSSCELGTLTNCDVSNPVLQKVKTDLICIHTPLRMHASTPSEYCSLHLQHKRTPADRRFGAQAAAGCFSPPCGHI